MTRAQYTADVKRRYWRFVQRHPGNKCWGWTGASHGGYGQISDGRRKKVRAHRLSWIIHRGPIPPGMCVLHRCDNPECSNPRHLFLGTKKDNTQDMVAKGRSSFGSRNGQAVLREQDVVAILKRHRTSPEPFSETASEYGVCVQTIRNIIHGITWKNVSRQ